MTKTISRTVALAAVLAFGAVTGPALAVGPPAGTPHSDDNPGTSHEHHAAGHASPNAHAHAYGTKCAAESKKHVAGMHGTPFSQCVTAMAKLAHGHTKSPAKACKLESKKHVAGMHGTPFSQCVSGGAKLLAEQKHAAHS